MSIEKDLNRIATALEVIANNIAVVGAHTTGVGANVATPAPADKPTPAAAPVTPPPEIDTRSPQQKAADTRRKNKAAKDAEHLAATEAGEKSNVTPITPAPVLASPAAIATPAASVATPVAEVAVVEAVTEEMAYIIPGTLEEMSQMANAIAAQLGPRVNEIGELLAGTYQVSKLSELSLDYYAGFARDLHALVGLQA